MNKTDLVWLLFKSLKKLSFTHPLNHRCDRIVGPFTEHIADGMVHEHPISSVTQSTSQPGYGS